MILIPSRLSQISCFTLSLKCFSVPNNAPVWGSNPCFSPSHTQPPPPGAGPVLLTLIFFPLPSFVLPNFAWVYVFFSGNQVLMPTLRWCSAISSVSESVFMMYPWREMYSRSTYSSAILFSLFPHLQTQPHHGVTASTYEFVEGHKQLVHNNHDYNAVILNQEI